VRRGGRAELMPASRVVRAPARDAVAVIGVKFTTARLTAAAAVDAACRGVPGARGRSRTGESPLPHAGIADAEGRLIETARGLGVALDRDVAAHLAGWYSTEAADVLNYSATQGLLDRLSPDGPVLCGEIGYAAEYAEAMRLADAVLRRTPLGSAGHPGRPVLERAAAIMAARRGWSPEQTEAEVASVERVYGAPARAAGAPPATGR
jgi:glycerol-3-phosphate dehydrogenase